MFALSGILSNRHRDPFHDEVQRSIAGRFGMWLLLLALAMLFGSSLVAFLVIRIQLNDVWPRGQITLPKGLWISTGLMALSSVTIHYALRAVHRQAHKAIVVGLGITFVLGVLFLIVQVQCWLVALAELRTLWPTLNQNRLALTGFYLFSGVHGLHVIAGLIPLAVITVRASRRRYTPSHAGGVQYITMYWHFLDGVWIVLFTTLLIGL